MHIDFIRGVISTLNLLHWKVKEDSQLSLAGYGCDILSSNKIKGTIYFDDKRQEYFYSEFK